MARRATLVARLALGLAALLAAVPPARAVACGNCYNNWDFWGWDGKPRTHTLDICAGGTVTFRWRGWHGVWQLSHENECPTSVAVPGDSRRQAREWSSMLAWTSRVSEWTKLAHADAWSAGGTEWGAGWGGRRAYRMVDSGPWVAEERGKRGERGEEGAEEAGDDAASSPASSGVPRAVQAARSWPAPEPVTAAFVRTASMQSLSTALSVANHEAAVASARRGDAGAQGVEEAAKGADGRPGASMPLLPEIEDVANGAAAIADEVAAALQTRAKAQVHLSSLPPAASGSTRPAPAAAEAERFRRRPLPSSSARAEEAFALQGDGSVLELESLRAAARALETRSERVTWDEVLEGGSAEARRTEGDAPPRLEAESPPDARLHGDAGDSTGTGRRLVEAVNGSALTTSAASSPAAAPPASDPPPSDQSFDASDDAYEAPSEAPSSDDALEAPSEAPSSDDALEDGAEIEESENDLDASSLVGAPEPAPGPSPEQLPPPPPRPLLTYIPGPAPNPNVKDELLVTGELHPVAQGTRLPMFVWTMPSSAGIYYATSQAGDDCEDGMFLIVRVIATSGPCS